MLCMCSLSVKQRAEQPTLTDDEAMRRSFPLLMGLFKHCNGMYANSVTLRVILLILLELSTTSDIPHRCFSLVPCSGFPSFVAEQEEGERARWKSPFWSFSAQI